MDGDRELLGRAAEAAGPLAGIGRLAMHEHAAWVERNAARAALQKWLRWYLGEAGEWFRRDEADPEDVAAFYPLKASAQAAQKRLTAARAATRRAIVRAAAAMAPAKESEHG